jgi:hypothetical protein
LKSSALLIVVFGLPALAQYSGPAILSRGEAPAAMASPQIEFRPFIEVSAMYDNGLSGVAVNDAGQLANASSSGSALTWGISGSHSWRHTKVGLEYRGGVSYYARQKQFSNLDQSLLLGVTHQISRHLSVTLRQTAGLVTRDFGQYGLRETVPFDPITTYVPVTDYFDNRTIFSTTQADLQLQKTARLSFVWGGGAYLVRRRSQALSESTSLSAHGDVQYRLTRRQTIGAEYQYMHFSYPHIFGGTDAHGVVGTYAIRMNRRWELSAYGGFLRMESTFIQTVAVDPTIAALLGISSAPEIAHRIKTIPNAAGRLSRTYRTGLMYVSVGHSVNPGNGIFLTSTMTQALGGYSYTGLRNWSFGAAIGYNRATSVGTITGDYADKNETLLVSRLLRNHFHFVVSYSARQYSSPTFPNYNRNINDARIGIGYSPGDIPLRVW